MQLDEFVKQTLEQIAKGVKDAQSGVQQSGGAVNPRSQQPDIPLENQLIAFDVAVTVHENVEGKAGAGIFVAAIGLGAQTKAGTSSEAVSRVSFDVPLKLPES